MEASEAQATDQSQTEAPQEGQSQDQGSNNDAIAQQLENLSQRFDAQFPQDQQPEYGGDLFQNIMPGQEDYGDEQYDPQYQQQPQYDQAGVEDYGLGDDGASPQEAERALEEWMMEKAQEAQAPLIAELRSRDLNALADEFPDLKSAEVQQAIIPTLQKIGNGDPDRMTDPGLVRIVYQAYKGQQASDSEVPAEEAAKQGASLETNAGPSQPDDNTEQEQWTRAFEKMASSGDGIT